MKRVSVVLLLISLSLVVFAREPSQKNTDKIVLSRGHPDLSSLIVYAPSENTVIHLEGILNQSPGIAVKNSAVLIELAICTGIRKIRDVDLCSVIPIIYNYNEDKRSAITDILTRLAREPNTVTT